ncbi:MAG: hypothetical protein GXX96_09260 [Planctomycetaceae bacterium]|nr:hypothetical protein [Planctomycetaceae bacterium]
MATWCVGIGTPVLVWALVRKRVSGSVASSVMIAYWAACGILTAWYLPGTSYLFTVPAAVACVSRLIASWRGFRWESANLAFLLAACALWLPLARGLVDALGFLPSFTHTVPLALMGLLIAPTIAADTRIFRFLLLVLSLVLVALVTAMVVPTYSEQWPQPVSVIHTQYDNEARLFARANLGRLPESMRHAITRPPEDDLPHYVAWKAEMDVAPPTVELVTEVAVENGRRLKLLLKPGENQHRFIVAVDPDFGSDVTLNGRRVETPLKGLALDFSEMTEAEIELTRPGKVKLRITALYYGLPPSAESLRKARPAWAAPGGRGDHTEVVTQLEF